MKKTKMIMTAVLAALAFVLLLCGCTVRGEKAPAPAPEESAAAPETAPAETAQPELSVEAASAGDKDSTPASKKEPAKAVGNGPAATASIEEAESTPDSAPAKEQSSPATVPTETPVTGGAIEAVDPTQYQQANEGPVIDLP